MHDSRFTYTLPWLQKSLELHIELCPAGTHRDGDCCEPCVAGKYQSKAGSTQCDECSPGKYQSKEGTAECVECGRYFDLEACAI